MKFLRSFTALLFMILFVSVAQGQWKLFRDFGAQVYSIHFLDREGYPQIGFVGLTTGEVWRTSDAGISWKRTNTPANLIGQIRDFSFKDSLTGWLAVSQASLYPGCYKTTDGGITWTALSPLGQRMAIFYNRKTQALILNGWNGAVSIVSLDFGATWAGTGNVTNSCGLAFTDSLHGLMTIFPANLGGFYSSTTDGGLTWTDLTHTSEAYQPLAIKGTRTYFICAEGARRIQRSDDDGKTWTVVHQFPLALDLSGDIRGDLSALYIQGKLGVKFSIDQGVTWTDYCGPRNDFDTRMYNIGSDSLYAGTLEGELWLNPFGVKKNGSLLQFPKVFDLTSQSCKSIDSLFRFINLSNCLPVKIVDMTIISGPGSKTFTFKRPIFPRNLDSLGDSVKITYTPDDANADSAQFFIKYSVGGELFQFYVKLRGFVKQGFNVSLSKDLVLLLSSDCSKLDTFVIVKSGPCSPDTLLAVSLSNTTAFSVTPPPLPAAIPANGSLSIPISIKTLPAGPYSATLTLTIRSGGVTRDTTINLNATILSSSDPRTILSPAIAKFDTVSTCDFAIDTIVMKNTICKKLFVKNVAIQGAGTATEYKILYAGIIGNSLAQNDTAQVLIQYKPTVAGPIAGTVIFTIGFDLTTTKDTGIAISGIGKALVGSGLEKDLLAFSAITPCTQQELSTQLYNRSCAEDTIVAILPTRDNSFSVLSPVTPLTIASGDSTLIRIQENPLSPGAKFDSVRVIIHSSSGAIDTVNIKVSGIVNKPAHVFSLQSLLQLDSLAPCTPLDTIIQLKNLGLCDTLTVDSIALTGPNWISLNNSIILSRKIPPDSSFYFTVHLLPGEKANGTARVQIKGIGIDTIVTINANSRSSGAPLTLTLDSVFLSSLCKSAIHTFTIQNTSCDPLVLDDLTLKNSLPAGTQFTMSPNPNLPVTIQPGAKLDLVVTFDPLAIGDSTATFTYRSTISGITRTIRLTGKLGTIRQSARVEVVIDPNLKTVVSQAGTNVKVRILMLDAVDPSLGLQKVTSTLTYYDNVLSFVRSTASAGWSVSPTLGTGSTTLDITKTDNNPVIAGAEIASAEYETFVADSAYTPIDLQNIGFNNADPIFESCVLSPQSMQPVVITIDPECGTPMMRGFINHDNTIFSGLSIRPNPVGSGTKLSVNLQLNQKTDITLTLCDALGRTVSRSARNSLGKGLQDMSVDLQKNASGFYILSVEAGGKRESRKIVIEE